MGFSGREVSTDMSGWNRSPHLPEWMIPLLYAAAAFAAGLWTWSWKWFWIVLAISVALTTLIQVLTLFW